MKKIVIISIIFTAMLGLGIWEQCFTTRFFGDIKSGLELVEQSIYASGDSINNAETLSLMDEVSKRWKKGREIIFCLGNHNTFRTLDEKLTSLDVMVKINYIDDAKVMVEVAKNLVESLNNDTHFIWSNIF